MTDGNQENNEEQNNSIIQYSHLYGCITLESKCWDDFEDKGEKELLKNKITKIKVFTGKFNENNCILGISVTFRNIFTGKELKEEHKGSDNFIDVKEFVLKGDEYLTDFHIRGKESFEYISELGFITNKKREFFVGTKEGDEKMIPINGEGNIIVGTFGHLSKKLDAAGVHFISKKEFTKISLFGFFLLRHLVKKDQKFKEEKDNEVKNFPKPFQYIWKTINLPDNPFYQIIKYCYL